MRGLGLSRHVTRQKASGRPPGTCISRWVTEVGDGWGGSMPGTDCGLCTSVLSNSPSLTREGSVWTRSSEWLWDNICTHVYPVVYLCASRRRDSEGGKEPLEEARKCVWFSPLKSSISSVPVDLHPHDMRSPAADRNPICDLSGGITGLE